MSKVRQILQKKIKNRNLFYIYNVHRNMKKMVYDLMKQTPTFQKEPSATEHHCHNGTDDL